MKGITVPDMVDPEVRKKQIKPESNDETDSTVHDTMKKTQARLKNRREKLLADHKSRKKANGG